MTDRTPFHKLLVANRGEIAVRVMRTARQMGYATVAVHSTVDAGARHVLMADEAVAIGSALPADSYLRIDRLVAAARATGADAIHPGYGFLAENAAFASACAAAGIVFVGPSPAAILAMGHKAGAKRLMLDAGVPCIPGYEGAQQDEAVLLAEAARIGWPVMIKASAGGGGRGMRLVRAGDEFAALLQSARSEARGAFGDDHVILERALVEPRHIEVQIVADRHGRAIHLGERDCSVQRRHQKVIEEAPSPAVDAALRARMGAVAVAAVQAIGYEGVGTLEFLLDRDGNFFFMEMNTRLQVEHPVTEAITGLDLVELQLRVAAGEALPLTQEEVRFNGHAIEVRLCAEDPVVGFMPQSGELALWRPSSQLRVEHGLNRRAEVSPAYDSMIAKLVAHGRDRDAAVRRLLHGLADTVALGLPTNQAFLGACLRHPVFARGQATTGFIDAHAPALLATDAVGRRETLALACALLHAAVDEALPHPFELPVRLALDGEVAAVTMNRGPGAACTLGVGEHRIEIELLSVGDEDVRFRCDGVTRRAVQVRDGPVLHLHHLGRAWHLDDRTRAAAVRHASAGTDGSLRATMNGRVVAVFVAVGDEVTAGQPMLTLEAMKMEHVHAAPVSGRVKALAVCVGEQVGAHRVVAEVEPTAAR